MVNSEPKSNYYAITSHLSVNDRIISKKVLISTEILIERTDEAIP